MNRFHNVLPVLLSIHYYNLTINKRLLPEFGDKKLSNIKTIHVVNYLNELREPGNYRWKLTPLSIRTQNPYTTKKP
ncbi:tyrosine-type recombinase/integrase [Salibacterium aidingense]|uniref:hypothetical protein n=1 Tax=Salibacterium aidingense TaxID=384933 RepID=UPI000A053E34